MFVAKKRWEEHVTGGRGRCVRGKPSKAVAVLGGMPLPALRKCRVECGQSKSERVHGSSCSRAKGKPAGRAAVAAMRIWKEHGSGDRVGMGEVGAM